MGFRGLLVRVPTCPFRIDSLRPDRRLAVLAATLSNRGHAVEVRDFGTVETLARVWHPTRRNRLFGGGRAVRSQLNHEISKALLREPGLDFVVLAGSETTQAREISEIASQIRAKCDRVRLLAWDRSPNDTSRRGGAIDSWFTGANPFEIADCLDRMTCGEALGFEAARGRIGATAWTELPRYDAGIYPNLHNATMLHVFDLAMERVIDDNSVRNESAKAPTGAIARLVREAKRTLRAAGPGAFHVRCEHGDRASRSEQSLVCERLAVAFHANGLMLEHSMHTTVASVSSRGLSDLADLGCRAIAVEIGSGSQQLVDRFHGAAWTVSRTEEVLRAARFRGIFTEARLTFPHAAEDFHTQAETERLIHRSQPHAVTVSDHGHRPATRFAPFDRDGFNRSLHRARVLRSVDAETALLAHLAGHAGNEAAFASELSRQFESTDAEGLGAAVERINGGIAREFAAQNATAERIEKAAPSRQAIGN